MKKNLFFMGLMALGMSLGMVSCSSDDDNKNDGGITEEQAQNLDYSAELANAWGNYALNVANLLKADATALNDAWTTGGFANQFKNHTAGSGYQSAENCVEEIFQGCIDIAGEVGTAKIGEPVDYWTQGQKNKALYAVESWYSWHSRDDYKNNILSIANSFLGKVLDADVTLNASLASQADQNSLYAICSAKPALSQQTEKVWNDVCAAWQAIDNIPQPFRNNIGSTEAAEAMEACATLGEDLETLQALVADNLSEDECQAIVNQFVDGVALPTYSALKSKVEALYAAIQTLKNNPTNDNFEAAAEAWLAARQPWESSEAFLFGPVAELGLDPNMDSWPLDAVGIYNLLQSQNWSEMSWSGDYDEENENIEAAQSLRGFHTLEFLIFKDGQPRKAN